MFNKLVVALTAVLVVTAQAGHVKHHHPRRHYGEGYGAVARNSTSVAPQSTSSASPVPTSSGTVPVGPGSSTGPPLVISSTSTSASLLPTSSVPSSIGSSASLLASSSIPLGTGSSAPPFPVISASPSASQNPSSKVPLGTGVTGAPAKQVSLVTSDTVLTYTIGTGSSTTVVVTTVRHTRTSTVVQTIYATKPSTGELAATASPESEGHPKPRLTSTTRIYRTSTAFVTVYPVPSETAGASEKNIQAGQDYIKAIANNCPAQVTITVPGPEVTVTVTATPPAATPSGAVEDGVKAPTTTPSKAVEGGVEVPTTTPSKAVEGSVGVPTASALPSLNSSALFNNGTEAATRISKTKCKSTGFLTRTSASFTAAPSATGIYHS